MPQHKSGTAKNRLLSIPLAAMVLILLLSSGLPVQTAFAKTVSTQSGEGVEATIRRSPYVRVIYHGEQFLTSASGETAGELLSRLGLDIAADDVVSHSLDTRTVSSMTLRIDRVIHAQESYTTTLPHDVRYCNDPTLAAGTEEVLVPGTDGELLCLADVTYTNGKETRRKILKETVTTAPVTEVIARGTGEATEEETPEEGLVISDGYITLPTGEVMTYTHTAQIRATAYTHTDAGCDFITATGTTVHIGTVAVDPRYIPYSTRMFIVSNDGEYVYGISVAEDCGGAIKGDRMDLYFPTYNECIQFGRRNCTIYFLG